MTFLDLQALRHRQPFKPFLIRTENGSVFDIHEPWMVLVGETSAVVVTEIRTVDRGYKVAMHWSTISISHIVELSDIDSRENRKRKRA